MPGANDDQALVETDGVVIAWGADFAIHRQTQATYEQDVAEAELWIAFQFDAAANVYECRSGDDAPFVRNKGSSTELACHGVVAQSFYAAGDAVSAQGASIYITDDCAACELADGGGGDAECDAVPPEGTVMEVVVGSQLLFVTPANTAHANTVGNVLETYTLLASGVLDDTLDTQGAVFAAEADAQYHIHITLSAASASESLLTTHVDLADAQALFSDIGSLLLSSSSPAASIRVWQRRTAPTAAYSAMISEVSARVRQLLPCEIAFGVTNELTGLAYDSVSGLVTTATTQSPSGNPTGSPSLNPTRSPSQNPTQSPSQNPTGSPSGNPTQSPSGHPTLFPTRSPSRNPSRNPLRFPTIFLTANPSWSPVAAPSVPPPASPSASTRDPSASPSGAPSPRPTRHLPTSGIPTTLQPTTNPTRSSSSDPVPAPAPSAPTTHEPTTSPVFFHPHPYPTARPTVDLHWNGSHNATAGDSAHASHQVVVDLGGGQELAAEISQSATAAVVLAASIALAVALFLCAVRVCARHVRFRCCHCNEDYHRHRHQWLWLRLWRARTPQKRAIMQVPPMDSSSAKNHKMESSENNIKDSAPAPSAPMFDFDEMDLSRAWSGKHSSGKHSSDDADGAAQRALNRLNVVRRLDYQSQRSMPMSEDKQMRREKAKSIKARGARKWRESADTGVDLENEGEGAGTMSVSEELLSQGTHTNDETYNST